MPVWREFCLHRSLFCRHAVPIGLKRLLHNCLAELLPQRLFNRFDLDRFWLSEILRRVDPFAQHRARWIVYFHRLDRGATIGQIRREDIQRKDHHRQVCPGHFDEEFIVTHPYFSDFPAIDNRRKRQRLVLRIAEDRAAGSCTARIGPYSNPLGWTMRISHSVIAVSMPNGVNRTSSGFTKS